MASPPYDSQGKCHNAAGLFRRPIAPSLSPTTLQWEPASVDLLSVLVDVFGPQSVFLVASGTSAAEISYCRVKDVARNFDLFVKILPKRFAGGLQRSGGISSYIYDCGVLTPVCRPGFPEVCIDGRMIFAYPFVDGSFFSNSMGDLQMLGSALARLHKALVMFPNAHRVARSQCGVRARMRLKAKKLLADKHWASGELSLVRTHLLRWLEIDALIDKSECQVIHNDLNAGNMLKDTKGNVWFLDFEEARWSYLPLCFDIARVIERFILVNEAWDIPTKIIASQRLLDAYSVAHDDNSGMEGRIPIALGWLLGFSWLRMSGVLFDPEAIQHPEVRKFLRLAELLDENEPWLAAL